MVVPPVRRLLATVSRISVRLLAFNVLLVFMPASGVLVLDTYERHLLAAQERTMSQEGRLLAAAFEASGSLDVAGAEAILVHLGQRHLARLRVVDARGNLLADSARLGPRREPGAAEPAASDQGLLYRLASLPFRVVRSLRAPSPQPALDPYDGADWLLGPEIRAALDGRYGARTRVSPGSARSVTLYVAIPVREAGAVAGAILVSQSTSRIVQALHAVRLDVFKVFLASLGAAIVLTLLVATTIARPLARLRRQAEAIVDRRGRLRGVLEPSRRRDEIGDLERALAELTRRLDEQLRTSEAFVGDLTHELKNPLASIRTATEMALELDDPEQRRRFLTLAEREVARMERLLSGLREISRIDAGVGEEEPEAVRLDELLPAIVEGCRLRPEASGRQLVLAISDHDLLVDGSADRLTQVFENLLANALSFSPRGGTVRVTVAADGEQARVAVADQGPGIPPEHRKRVFSRFFSYRPDDPAREHSGLGLAIVRAIVEAHGGSVMVADRPAGGAELVVTLPRAAALEA